MIKAIIKRFVPDYQNVSEPVVREKYGVLGGTLGIVCNIFLFIIKIGVGATIGSIAVISDAFNNLSDFGSSLVSVIGSRLSGKRADEDHPYGHGRAEYISAFLIGILIVVFGIELLKSAAAEIVSPSDIGYNRVALVILSISIPIKLWMWHYNRFMGKRIQSPILLAAARDSLNDLVATCGVIASAILSPFVAFPLDGIAGICISFMIMWTGIGIARNTIDRLLGAAPPSELIHSIEKKLMDEKKILGTHDLMVHDYGPGRTIASVHAEVPDDLSIVEVHNVIDAIENDILRELGVDIVIHMDPVPHKE